MEEREKVIVVKRIPGILEVGDILISDGFGQDFILELRDVSKSGSMERYVNLDYYTVSGNIPEYFDFVIEDEESGEDFEFEIRRSNEEIKKRYNYFIGRMGEAPLGTEERVVYCNLVWFIEWLTGVKDLVR